MSLQADDRVEIFDPLLWGGKDRGDNSQFYKPATVIRVYEEEHSLMVDVRFDHRPRSVSHGHFIFAIRRKLRRELI